MWQQRIDTLAKHLTPLPCSSATSDVGNECSDNITTAHIAQRFCDNDPTVWQLFEALPTWQQREEVVQSIRTIDIDTDTTPTSLRNAKKKEKLSGWSFYKQLYHQQQTQPLLLDSFISSSCSTKGTTFWRQQYRNTGHHQASLLVLLVLGLCNVVVEEYEMLLLF